MKAGTLLALPALILALQGAIPLAALAAPPAAEAGVAAVPRIAFEKTTLSNGLQLILVENRKLPIAAVNLWYHVGPANEEPGLTGFAHLFEHMMFAATKHAPRGLADRLLEGAGATDSNGSTDFDRTNYYDTVPSNQLELALWIHADRMGYLLDVLDQAALSNQQDVVRNERRESVEERPYGIVEEALYHTLFPASHPYYASVIGSHADIQNAQLADIRNFFKQYYGPNNASLVIVGDIDKARTRALVEKYFGSFRRGPDVARPALATPPLDAERRVVVEDKVELARVFMGWLTPPAYGAGDAELTVAAQILAGGKSSRLYKALVYDQQLAQDVNASPGSNALTSIFVIDVTARPGRTARQVEAAIDAELEALRRDGPSDQEVERARNTIETALLTGVEKFGGTGLANQLNHYNQYLGDPGYLGRDIERIRRVTAADVRRVVAAQLKANARAVVHGVPGTPDLGKPVPTPAAPKAACGQAEAVNPDEAWRNSVPKPGPAPALALPRGVSFTLANGLTVIHHYNPELPLVAAELVVKSGSGANPPARPGLASFTAQLLEEGTPTRSAPRIADEMAQLGAFIGTASGFDSSRASIVALKTGFAQALDVLADVVQRPTFPAAEVERQRASRLGELSQQREDPPTVAAVAAAAALYGTGHPYGRGELGTEDAIKDTTRADLLAFWQRHYVPGNCALVVAGDIPAAELKRLAQDKFGAWEARAPAPPAAAAVAGSSARVVLVDKPGAQQSALRVTALGPDRKTPDYPQLQVLNAALGGLFTSRINHNLREEKGYSYGVFSQFLYRRAPGPFAIAGSVRTDVTGASVREIFKEVRAVRARPLPQAELANARNAQVLSLPGQFDTNQSVGASLATMFVYDLGLDYYSKLPRRLAAVSAAQVQQAARAYLAPANMIVIAVGDKKKIVPQLRKLRLGKLEERDADGNPR